MEAFTFLKYWRAGELGGGAPASSPSDGTEEYSGTTNSFVTAKADDFDSDEDGPFFDLEFAVPDDDDDDNASTCAEDGGEGEGSDEESESEFDFALSSDSGEDLTGANLSLSPSDDLFFKGRLVTVEPAEPDASKPVQFPASLRKSATKFRVLMLGFKKSKQSTAEKTEHAPKQPAPEKATAGDGKEKRKLLTVKFRVEEVRIMSLFTASGKTSTANKASAPEKQSRAAESSDELSSADEKRFSKDVVQKYLRKVKPLYVRVSRRYGDKLRFSGQLTLGSGAKHQPAPPETKPPTESTEAPAPKIPKTHKQSNIQAGLRAVSKHLGKNRSASSAVAAAPPPPPPSKRRDDSLLQLQDGIQGAILHCKNSFNASRDPESSVRSLSVSDSAEDELSGGDYESRQSSRQEHGAA